MNGPTRTTCPYCGVGCGVLARVAGAEVHISGDPAHPANRGALCSKGAALGETLQPTGRLLRPRIGAREVGWDDALRKVATGFRRVIERHGANAVAFYVSGQLLTEDYYVANKLMKGFIGSANIDTNSRLCMSSAVAAHKRAFGEDLVGVTYEDLELADLVVLVGSNTAWCHPVLYQRIIRARERRPCMRVVVIDPRRTPTCDLADLHLPLRSGTDVVLFNGLLAWLSQQGLLNEEFLDAHTRGAARAVLVAENTAGSILAAAHACGVDASTLQLFYEWFGASERVISMFSQGVNQSSSGTDKANSIINVHLATGRIGRPGMGPFSVTGQPNAMGGREVGGLANMLAAHMELDNEEHRALVRQFWGVSELPERPGLKAIELFEAMYDGRVKAVWIMATNPIVSLPNAARAREALERCELVVVSDCVAATDTTAYAHVLLPAHAWGEKDGTVTNSDRHISRQRAFLAPAGEARADWWIICQVARRMGYTRGFEFEGPEQIFAEHAALSAYGNDGGRAFDLGGLAMLSAQDYADLEPVPWPVRKALGVDERPAGTDRLFTDRRFFHPDQRARLVATRPRAPRYTRDEEYPLILNTGRIRDQWHSMTRSGLAPRLGSHLPEPYIDMHAADALSFGLRQGTLVRATTRWGSLVARLRTSGEVARGSIFVPIHWSDQWASDARVGALVNPAADPISGEPEFKHTPARVEPFLVAWYGFALSRGQIPMDNVSWWVRVQGLHFTRYEMAGRNVPGSWEGWVRRFWLNSPDAAEWIEYEDRAAGIYRVALLRNERLEACVFISPRPDLPERGWLAGLFSAARITVQSRASLLSGRARDPAADTGATVCACFGVGRNAIKAAIADGCRDTRAVGERLKAGTNCGSCVPEIRRLIAETAAVTNDVARKDQVPDDGTAIA